jgi:hypothetical protein
MKNAEKKRRNELYKLLGDLPSRNRRISATLVKKEEQDGYILEKLMLDLNGFEPVPAYFVKPLRSDKPTPCILYNHAHGGDYKLGKDELICGRSALQSPCYAKQITSMGYSALCVDTWLFGERRGRTESEVFKEMLWNGQVLWGMMVYDNIRAMDYLISRSDVDRRRIGTMGISMGSTMAWWTAALDTRVKVCIDLCCLTDFETIIKTRGLDGHGIYYYVPSLLKHFSTAQINELIAPRPHLGLVGIYDLLTPPEGLDIIDSELKKTYAKMNAKDNWKLSRYDIGHFETAAMRAEIIKFLKKHI